MLHFEGDRELKQLPPVLFTRLSDARFLLSCLPGVETTQKAEADTAVWTLRPGLSFMRGTLEITLRVLDAVPEQSVRYEVVSKGIGSSSTVSAAVRLVAQEDGTRLYWQADVLELGGLLKAVPQGLIKASAQKVIADIWAALEPRLVSEVQVGGEGLPANAP